MTRSAETASGSRARVRRWLAWGLLALYLGIAALAAVVVSRQSGAFGVDIIGFLSLGYAVVGALAISRQPGNAVGWLLFVIALAFEIQVSVDAYLATPSTPPGASVAGWLTSWLWIVWLYFAAILLPLVFPDGRLLTRRWRAVVVLAVVGLLTSVIGVTFKSGPFDVAAHSPVPNPLGVGGTLGVVVDVVGRVGDVLTAIAVLLAGVSLALRLHLARGRVRQQVKWFAYVGVLTVVGLLMAMVEVLSGEGEPPQWVTVIGGIGWGAALFLILIGVPAAVGMAMLRHRLYDVDVVITRTLVYGALTAALGLTYLAMVLLGRLVLNPLTEDNDLAIAVSTLAVAGLFGPLRSRIQAVVDRRFYRQRYDAVRTLESFGAQLRDELDLESLGEDLRGVVRQTMQPAHVSLWLRGVPR
ncbi:MAG: hypothetical protein ACRDOY_07625 [Nocardioidaceae bacterium]